MSEVLTTPESGKDPLQERVGAWARAYWPDRDAQGHTMKMFEEAGEVAECWTKEHKRPHLGEELADVVICALATADKAEEDINVLALVRAKMAVNETTKLPGSY